MPIRPVFEQIGERFGRFDSAVRTSFPLPSYLVFTLTLAPVDPVLSTHHPMHPHTLTGPYVFVDDHCFRGNMMGIWGTVRLETGTSE